MPHGATTWSDRGLDAFLHGTRFDDVRWFDRLDSTNTHALAHARAGTPEGLVVVADCQTAGRGRLGRRWESPPGASLLVSVLMRPVQPEPQRVTMAAALALVDAVATVAGVTAGLKWPNDLLVGERKLAGILAESDGTAVVVGVGCNVNWADTDSAGAPEGATACDLEAGRPVDREALLVAFLRALEGYLGAPDRVVASYRDRLDTLGRQVRIKQTAGELHGVATDLAPDGALVITTDHGDRVVVHVGDVVHLR